MRSPGNDFGQARALERLKETPPGAQSQSCPTFHFSWDHNLSPRDTELDLLGLLATLHEPRVVCAVGAGGFLANPSFFHNNKIVPWVVAITMEGHERRRRSWETRSGSASG